MLEINQHCGEIAKQNQNFFLTLRKLTCQGIDCFYYFVCVFVCVQPALVVLLCLYCVFCVRLTHLIKIAAIKVLNLIDRHRPRGTEGIWTVNCRLLVMKVLLL